MKKQYYLYMLIKKSYILILFFVLSIFVLSKIIVFAENISSTNYSIENPTFILEGGISQSNNFKYISSTGEYVIGESSGNDFINRSGFLYFPIASTPILQATPGNGSVFLSWTQSQATLANITNYELGISTSQNGTYNYTPLGNILSYTKTGLTNNTPYYFKIRSYASGLFLNESTEISSTPVNTNNNAGGGGGGGTFTGSGTGGVTFSGNAYPKSTVTLMKDAQIITSTVAGSDSVFSVNISSITSGNYIFSVYSEDNKGNRSSLLTFPVSVTNGANTSVSGVFISPTIAIDKSQVKKGDNIAIFGQTIPKAEVTIAVNSEPEFFNKVSSNNDGVYLLNFDTSVLEKGDHSTKSKSAIGGQISSYGKPVSFIVGDKTILATPTKICPAKGDLNNDCKVNLIDYSIAAYWYKRVLDAKTIILDQTKLNGDGKITLVDFSIIAYYWMK